MASTGTHTPRLRSTGHDLRNGIVALAGGGLWTAFWVAVAALASYFGASALTWLIVFAAFSSGLAAVMIGIAFLLGVRIRAATLVRAHVRNAQAMSTRQVLEVWVRLSVALGIGLGAVLFLLARLNVGGWWSG